MHKITDWALYHSMELVLNGCINYFNSKDKEMQDRVFENLKIRFGFYFAKTILNRLGRQCGEFLLSEAIENIINVAGLDHKHIKFHSNFLAEWHHFILQYRLDVLFLQPSAIRGSIETFMARMKVFEDTLLFKPSLDGKDESELDRDLFIEFLRLDTKVSCIS